MGRVELIEKQGSGQNLWGKRGILGLRSTQKNGKYRGIMIKSTGNQEGVNFKKKREMISST